MKDIIDIDGIFDNFLEKYIKAHRGEYDEKQWEDKIPLLYDEFGKSPLKELGGATPQTYYVGENADALCEALKIHVGRHIPVSDFLCEALIAADSDKQLAAMINDENDEELVSYCINILNDKNSVAGVDACFEMLKSEKTCEDMRDLIGESLAANAEAAKERAIAEYAESGANAVYYLEILSNCKRDPRVTKILSDELSAHRDNITLYLSYVTKYGDESVLPLLYELIKNPEINYLDFKELKLAIEAFGGEYDEERDFTYDRYYKRLKNASSDGNAAEKGDGAEVAQDAEIQLQTLN